MRRVTLPILVAAVMLGAPVSRAAAPQGMPGPSPRNANYRLRATLDPATQSISGSGRLTWRNISRNPATELRFHLYWNAWRDANSSWMREQLLGRNRALAQRPPEDFSRIDVVTIGVGGQNLASRATFVAPDDGNPDDRTVLRVPLDWSVVPGQAIEIDLEWTARVPRTFARTGRLGQYYFIAQWFPKIGVLEDAGWNCHQFHAATEFFSDFGTYDVTLTVPSGWIVGATGTLESSTPAKSGVSHRFVQADVHDFAWTTSPDFIERRERFEEGGLPPVDMRLLLQPEHATQADRHFAATRAALKYYGTWFGAYPYAQITIVDPATIFDGVSQGESTGGMEYPTLFTAGSRRDVPGSGMQPESVTVHEAGHQFWYGLVATNEFEHAWMDEGLNTFSTARVLDAAFPGRFVAVDRYFGGLLAWPYADVPWSRAIDGNRLDAYRPVASFDDQSTPTWQVLARFGQRHHLQQDVALARDARAPARVADDAEDPGDLLRARRLPASDARRVLRRRERSQRAGPDLVLRRRASQLGVVRLRGRRRELHRARRPLRSRGRGAALRRRGFPDDHARDVQRRVEDR